jgi:hypothetical protein
LKLEAVLLGASLPTTIVWFTKTKTTAWFSVADIDAAAGTAATADICFCLEPGFTTSLVSDV